MLAVLDARHRIVLAVTGFIDHTFGYRDLKLDPKTSILCIMCGTLIDRKHSGCTTIRKDRR